MELEAARPSATSTSTRSSGSQAEFDNYRKRVARDQEESGRAGRRAAREGAAARVDDLERALEAADAARGGEARGGRPPRPPRARRTLLEREGLAEIETDGKFDPHVHEALLSQPSDEEEGTVIQVLQKGYRLGDQVLRPARVVVAAPTRRANG